MRVKVEATWNGLRDGEGFRLTFPCGGRESVQGRQWGRRTATEALDIAEHVYHLNRRLVRFDVH